MSNQGIRWNIDDLNEKQLALVKAGDTPEPTRKSKYNAVKTEVDGITFPSKKEAKIYQLLKLRSGVKFILRQIPFDLPGGYRHKLDFMVFYHDGKVEWVEAKGMDLAMGRMKRKQVEVLYGITIEVI